MRRHSRSKKKQVQVKNSIYNFEPDVWNKGVKPPPLKKSKPKKNFDPSIDFKVKKGCVPFEYHPQIIRGMNHSIFGNDYQQFDNFIQHGEVFGSKAGGAANLEDQKHYHDDYHYDADRERQRIKKHKKKKIIRNQKDFEDRKDELEQFGFVQRKPVAGEGDLFVNKFLRAKKKYDSVQKNNFVVENYNDQLAEAKVSGLKVIKGDLRTQDGVENQIAERNDFCNFKLDPRFLTEKEKKEGIKPQSFDNQEGSNSESGWSGQSEGKKGKSQGEGMELDFDNFLKQDFFKKNFVQKTANNYLKNTKQKFNKAQAIMEEDIRKMKVDRMPIKEKYRSAENKFRENLVKKERKTKKIRKKKFEQVRKIGRAIGAIAEANKKEKEELKKREAERQKEQQYVTKEAAKVMKQLKTSVDIPVFRQSVHLKKAIQNCKNRPKKRKKVVEANNNLGEFGGESQYLGVGSKVKIPLGGRISDVRTAAVTLDENFDNKEDSIFGEDSIESMDSEESFELEGVETPAESFLTRQTTENLEGEIVDDDGSFESLEIESVQSEEEDQDGQTDSKPKRNKNQSSSKPTNKRIRTAVDVIRSIKKAKNPALALEVKMHVDAQLKKMAVKARNTQIDYKDVPGFRKKPKKSSKLEAAVFGVPGYDFDDYEGLEEKMEAEYDNFEKTVKNKIKRAETDKLRRLLEERKEKAYDMRYATKTRILDHCKEIEQNLRGLEFFDEIHGILPSAD